MARRRPESSVPEVGSLGEYSTKRSFDVTPEPAPEPVAARTGPLLFVVQQHAARKLHFDFRLELDGVLKSWAVPKGLAIHPGEPHLAVPTEDHPLAYGSFEGVIPKGQYGAGTVIVWDCGLYSPDEGGAYAFGDRAAAQQRVRAELASGKLSFFLLGEKVKGSYALVRTKDKTWLLLKHRDGRALRAPGAAEPDRSVLTLYAVANVSNLIDSERLAFERLIPNGPAEPLPQKSSPMLAGTGAAPFSNPEWLFEPKLDGYRVVAYVAPERVQLRSRSGLDLTDTFPGIVEDLRGQIVQPLLIDGEVVALRDGHPSFEALQNRAGLKTRVDIETAERTTPCVFFCFDLVHALGLNLRQSPYSDRRRYLAQCLLTTPRVQLVHAAADGEALYRASIASGFEGMMAKRKASIYRAGQRSDDWLKVKHVQSAEFVIGGYTEGKGARRHHFGALVLGAWDGDQLKPVGNVGSGFDDATLEQLAKLLKTKSTATMPFEVKPEADGKMHWTQPDLVAEVQFAGWTDAGLLRAPVFLRLRNDADPRSVTYGRDRRLPATAREADAGEAIDPILRQLAGATASMTLTVNGQRIALTHLDKVLWPAHDGREPVTKRRLLRYLASVSPFMLHHLVNRPLTVIRMPDGIQGEAFFQKHWDGTTLPAFVRVIDLQEEDGGSKRYVLCNNVETLLWLGQMGVIEYHVPHTSVHAPERTGQDRSSNGAIKIAEREVFDRPDYVVFDLDPYIYSGQEPEGGEPEFNLRAFAKAREVALHLRDLLAAMSLRGFVKTTGKTGLHVFVPIERTISSEQARDVCRLVGEHLLRKHPDEITMDWAVKKRTGKIFFDHNMNGRGRTLNAAYSPRRIPGAWVSTPVSWDELATVEPGDFSVSTVIERLRDNGDPWQGILAARHDLTRVFKLPG
jgi:bifunctional non-homologous end joining protein LigD